MWKYSLTLAKREEVETRNKPGVLLHSPHLCLLGSISCTQVRKKERIFQVSHRGHSCGKCYSCSQSPWAHGHRGFGLSSWGGALTQNVFDFGVISKDGALPDSPTTNFPVGWRGKGSSSHHPRALAWMLPIAQKEMEFSALLSKETF